MNARLAEVEADASAARQAAILAESALEAEREAAKSLGVRAETAEMGLKDLKEKQEASAVAERGVAQALYDEKVSALPLSKI